MNPTIGTQTAELRATARGRAQIDAKQRLAEAAESVLRRAAWYSDPRKLFLARAVLAILTILVFLLVM